MVDLWNALQSYLNVVCQCGTAVVLQLSERIFHRIPRDSYSWRQEEGSKGQECCRGSSPHMHGWSQSKLLLSKWTYGMLLQRLILYLIVKIEYTSLNVCTHIVESRSGEGYDCKDCHLSTPEGLCSQVFNWRAVCYVHAFSHSVKTHLRSTSGQVQSKSTFRFRPLPLRVLSYLLLLKVAVKMSARRDRRKKLGCLLRCNLPLMSLLNLLWVWYLDT